MAGSRTQEVYAVELSWSISMPDHAPTAKFKKRTVFGPQSSANKYCPLNKFSQRFQRRLGLMILPRPTFSDPRRTKKADSFWSAPMSDKMLKLLEFLGVCQEL